MDGCYANEELKDWAARIIELGQKTTAVYIYFNNDAWGFAISNAQTLSQLLADTTSAI